MAKKEKTLKDLDLLELVREVSFAENAVNMYTDFDYLPAIMGNNEMKDKLAKSRDRLRECTSELMERFNAPKH